mgnify:CR=1 FL=1
MQTTLLITQLVLAVLLVLLILVQERGSGLGEAISGIGGSPIQTQKRGAEKILAQSTIVLVTLFLGLSLALNFIQ